MAAAFTTSQPILAWPAALPPAEHTLHLQYHTAMFSSPFTRTTQTQELPGALFRLTASFPLTTRQEKVDAARSWLARLRGAAGRFYWPASGCNFRIPSAYAHETLTLVQLDVSTTLVTVDRTDITIDADSIFLEPVFTPDGLSTDRTALTGTLWLNSNRNPLREGSYLSFDDDQGWRHLHIVVGIEEVVSTGATLIRVEPPMRFLPTATTAIHIANPSGVFMLNDGDQGPMAMRPGRVAALGVIEATQSFPIRVVV